MPLLVFILLSTSGSFSSILSSCFSCHQVSLSVCLMGSLLLASLPPGIFLTTAFFVYVDKFTLGSPTGCKTGVSQTSVMLTFSNFAVSSITPFGLIQNPRTRYHFSFLCFSCVFTGQLPLSVIYFVKRQGVYDHEMRRRCGRRLRCLSTQRITNVQ